MINQLIKKNVQQEQCIDQYFHQDEVNNFV